MQGSSFAGFKIRGAEIWFTRYHSSFLCTKKEVLCCLLKIM